MTGYEKQLQVLGGRTSRKVANNTYVIARNDSHACDARYLTTCGKCQNRWCSACDPAPSAQCHWCTGRGYSIAPWNHARVIVLKYHATDIVEYHVDGRIVLNTGGWRTSTTKLRFNESYAQLPIRNVYANKGVWWVTTHEAGYLGQY